LQYPSRKAAIKALKKFTPERALLNPDEAMTPAEYWLIANLIKIKLTREINRGQPTKYWRPAMEREYRDLKSIARGLGFFPIPDWAEKYVRVNERLSLPKRNRDEAKIASLGKLYGMRSGKLTALVNATNEILEDATGIEEYIKKASVKTIQDKINKAMLYGETP